MSTQAVSSIAPELINHLKAWAEALTHVLGEMSGSSFSCEILLEPPPEVPAPSDEDLWVAAVAAGAVAGECVFRLAPGYTIALAGVLEAKSPGMPKDPADQHREAAIEVFRRTSAEVATAVDPGNLRFSTTSCNPPSWSSAGTAWLRVSSGEAVPFLVELRISVAVMASLRRSATAISPGSSAGTNLDLVRDAELTVTLRFGHRRMLLKDILELSNGAVIELEQAIQDPVELLLGGRVIAQGEVVVVDGNYGFRVGAIFRLPAEK